MVGESVYPDATPELQLGLASSHEFTERELEVLREMTGGDTNQEIAEHLHMSVATVKTHILNMLGKTGFRNRTELAVRARESGLVILNRKNGDIWQKMQIRRKRPCTIMRRRYAASRVWSHAYPITGFR